VHPASLQRVLWNRSTERGESFIPEFLPQVEDPCCRRFSVSTKSQAVTPSKQFLQNLRKKTKQWMRIPLKSWTRREVSQGRFLMEAWSNINASPKERAVNNSGILRRWALERLTGNAVLNGSSGEIIEMLHRCLDSWRQVGTDHGQTVGEVMDLIALVEDACISIKDDAQRPGDKAYSMCLNVLANYPMNSTTCDDVLVLLNCRREHKDHPKLQFYNSCLHVLAKCSPYHEDAPERAEALFKYMSTTVNPNTASFISLMHAWASSKLRGSAERADAILDKMIDSHQESLDSRCFNVCINGWAKAGSPKKAEDLLWRMHGMYQEGNPNVQPNEVSFNSAINAWAKSQHPQAANRAEALLKKMESYGFRPTTESYTAVMDAWSRTPQPGPKVQSMLDRLEEIHSRGNDTLPPNKLSYVIAIRAWAHTRQRNAPEQAQTLLTRMEELSNHDRSELRPCVKVYSALIDAWSKSARADAPERAVSLFREMQKLSASGRKDTTPNTITLNTVLDSFARQGRAEEAHAFLKETNSLFSDGEGLMQPDNISYDTVMKGYSKSNTWDAAEHASELILELEELHNGGNSSLKPTVLTYTLAVLAWGNNRRHDAAEQAENILWRMIEFYDKGDRDAKPNVVTLNCVLRAWCRSREGGAAERAESIFRWMKEGGIEDIEPDATSYLHMILAWTNSGRSHAHKKAETYFNEIKKLCLGGKTGFVLTTGHFNATIQAMSNSCEEGALQRVENLVEEMIFLAKSGQKTAPNVVSFNYLIKAIAQSDTSDKRKRAENVVKKMKAWGAEPNLTTLNLTKSIRGDVLSKSGVINP
jgi:pentatricopeptide repeat protein